MSHSKLHGYWRSSATYRTRIVLHLKNIVFETVPVHLLKDGGEQKKPAFLELNPLGQVPVLEIEHAGKPARLTQSVAIAEYLDETHPEPRLLPADALERARVRAAVETINSGIQPLHNLPLLAELKRLGGDDVAWTRGAIERGLTSLEKLHEAHGGRFLVGDALSLADVFLAPQLYAARRFKADASLFPRLTELGARLDAMPAFDKARPEAQPDYTP